MSYAQNFDSGGSMPAGWAWNAAFSVTGTPGGGIVAVSSPNVLKLAATGNGTPCFGTYGTQDSNGGDTSASCWFNATGTTQSQYFETIVRGNNSDLSVAGKCYKARLDTGGSSFQLYRLVSGSPFMLATLSWSPSTPEWYNVKVQATGTSTTTITGTVKRRSDGKYLTSSGSWQVGQTAALTYSDATNQVTGAGYAGLAIVSKSDDAYADDFSFADVTPSDAGTMAATEGGDTPSIAGHFLSSATLAKAEGHDTPSIHAVSTVGHAAVAEHHDTPAFASAGSIGSMAAAEHRDTAAAVGDTPNAILTVLEGPDVPSFPAAFDVLGTLAATEARDIPALAGLFRRGVLAATERHDTASIAGHFGASATMAAAERPDAAAFAGQATHAVLAIVEAGDRAAIPAVAAGVPPYFKVMERGDVAAITAGLLSVRYHVYASPASGAPIDYSTPIATVDSGPYVPPPVSAPGAWSWGVRAFSGAGEEQNVDCVATVVFDASGADVSDRPDPPAGLRAFPTGATAGVATTSDVLLESGDRVILESGDGLATEAPASSTASALARVEWYSPPPVGPRAPTVFNVYLGAGTTPDYTQPIASVAYGSGLVNAYAVDLTGLIGGQQYAVAVRGANASGEGISTPVVTFTASGAGPLAVVGLTALATV